jgi:hypothetical protein
MNEKNLSKSSFNIFTHAPYSFAILRTLYIYIYIHIYYIKYNKLGGGMETIRLTE